MLALYRPKRIQNQNSLFTHVINDGVTSDSKQLYNIVSTMCCELYQWNVNVSVQHGARALMAATALISATDDSKRTPLSFACHHNSPWWQSAIRHDTYYVIPSLPVYSNTACSWPTACYILHPYTCRRRSPDYAAIREITCRYVNAFQPAQWSTATAAD